MCLIINLGVKLLPGFGKWKLAHWVIILFIETSLVTTEESILLTKKKGKKRGGEKRKV